jgi:hypothetical protein
MMRHFNNINAEHNVRPITVFASALGQKSDLVHAGRDGQGAPLRPCIWAMQGRVVAMAYASAMYGIWVVENSDIPPLTRLWTCAYVKAATCVVVSAWT